MAGGKHEQDIETSHAKSKTCLGSRHVSAGEAVQAWVGQIQLFSAAEHLDISNSGSMNSRLFGQFRGQAIQGTRERILTQWDMFTGPYNLGMHRGNSIT